MTSKLNRLFLTIKDQKKEIPMREIPKIEDVLPDYPEFTGIHPIANIFPMKPQDEFWELVEHIREAGLKNKLFREKGTGLLIDGRSRLLAVSITGSLFEIEDINPLSVLDAVIAVNLHAKKFDFSRIATIAEEVRRSIDDQAKGIPSYNGGTALGKHP
jgi:hypothetical protein